MLHFISVYFLIFSIYSQTNPWSLPITERILNRKHISHFTLGFKQNQHSVHIIVSDRFPYNYKSLSYTFFVFFKNSKSAMSFAQKLDKYLQSGRNIKIKLQGSKVISYEFL